MVVMAALAGAQVCGLSIRTDRPCVRIFGPVVLTGNLEKRRDITESMFESGIKHQTIINKLPLGMFYL